jgi:hypothetical protein
MKWIKPRKTFLNEEAKIKDVILPRQAREVARIWGEQWLNLEEIEPTDKIKQGKWKLSEEDKINVLGVFFGADLKKIYEFFENLPDKLKDVINQSINLDLLKSDDKWAKILDNFDIQKPTINQISVLTDPIFRKISVSETTADEIIIRDENGRPVMGEDGRPTKRRREEGEIIFSNNLVNINTFLADFNRLFTDAAVDATRFQSGDIQRLVSFSREDFGGDGYRVEVDLYGRDMFLSIKHNPKDIFNMSISRFYSSCQHLYSGGYRSRVIGNVFDPNSIPAFIVFDTPIYNSADELIAEQLPLTRMMIRNIESFDPTKESKIFFDRAYPDRMQKVLPEMIEKYSGNKGTTEEEGYLFTPDIPEGYDINEPYMDRLSPVQRGKYIGVNTKSICLSSSYNWSKVFISPKANLHEIIIETPHLPLNFFFIKLNPEWIKFKFIKINDMTSFSKVQTESWAFEKCKFTNKQLVELSQINKIKKIQFVACQIKNIDLSMFNELEELQLVYTIDSEELEKAIGSLKVKKLVLSGDLVESNKKYINSLKSKGVKVEIVGPVI